MPNIFQSLNTARSALFANRLGLDVTSHNIANVNTKGFSRQRVSFNSAIPLVTVDGIIGNGVEADSVRRIRDDLLDHQYREASHHYGKSNIRENIFYQVESILQEPSDSSIGSLMDDFFAAFSDLGGEPENMNIRNVVLQKSTNLTQAFQTRDARLRDVQTALRNETAAAVREINLISRQLSELNQQIAVTENSQTSANDLRDQRDRLLDDLAEFVQFQTSEDSQGMLSVSMNGQMLVSQLEYRQLNVVQENSNGAISVSILGPQSRPLNVQTGKLSGLLEMHNDQIVSLRGRLDEMAQTFIEQVNQVHRFGTGLPTGTPPAARTGLNLFTGSDAGTITVSDTISSNAANLAASLGGSVGNGDVAFTISSLRNQPLMNGRAKTFGEYYTTTISDIGTEIQLAVSGRRNHELLRDQVTNQRESVSGVSLDEEMTNIIKFQRSLEAASRVVGVIDEMLQTIVNM